MKTITLLLLLLITGCMTIEKQRGEQAKAEWVRRHREKESAWKRQCDKAIMDVLSKIIQKNTPEHKQAIREYEAAIEAKTDVARKVSPY